MGEAYPMTWRAISGRPTSMASLGNSCSVSASRSQIVLVSALNRRTASLHSGRTCYQGLPGLSATLSTAFVYLSVVSFKSNDQNPTVHPPHSDPPREPN
jgi:hypothetical protein